MALFKDWLIGKKLEYHLSSKENQMIDGVFALLRENALQQPQVPVHRDYHSRNLMICDNTPGILDFQDAVCGPITYDLVSLLKDCYIVWPEEKVLQWLHAYADKARAAQLTTATNAELENWFHLMGMQRHLKASGIFARLALRDNKLSYLDDIPRTVQYIIDACTKDERFESFGKWLSTTLMPLIESAIVTPKATSETAPL